MKVKPEYLSGNRLSQFDGIRGLAILLVIICHATMAYSEGADPGFFDVLISLGGSGVTLFFVLSGFLISGLLLNCRGQQGSLRRFYLRRLMRIIPAYYVCLLIYSFVLPWWVPEGSGFASSWLEAPAAHFSFLSNFHYFFKGGFSPEAMSVSWSLAIEEQFYLLWPLFFLFLPIRHIVLSCLIFAAGALAVRGWLFSQGFNIDQVTVFTPARLDSFALGGLLALAWRDETWSRRLKASRFWVLGGSAVAATLIQMGIPFVGPQAWNIVGPLSFLVSSVFYTALLTAVLAEPRFAAGFFVCRGMRNIGVVSYSVYLTHLGVIYGMILLGLNPSGIFGDAGGQLVFYPLAVIVSLLAGTALYFAVEKPALKLRNQLL